MSDSSDLMEVTRSFRGISLRLARHYLESVGGEVIDEHHAAGEDWEAELEADTVAIGPSLELTEVTVTFTGEEEALDEVVDRFAQKAIRAGG